MGFSSLISRLWLKSHLRAHTLAEIEPHLNTGDIVLLSLAKGDNYTYLTRVGTWRGITQIGFLVRKGSGPESLVLCHADKAPQEGAAEGQLNDEEGPLQAITITRLHEEVASGLYDVLVVRQLAKPLTEPERRAVELYVTECAAACANGGEWAGEIVACSDFDPRERANILMKAVQGPGCLRPSACLGADHERFFCSAFVAQMLKVAGRVRPGSGRQEFVPLAADWSAFHGRLLEPPLLVKLVDAPRPSSPLGSVRRRHRVTTMPQRLARATVLRLMHGGPPSRSDSNGSSRSDRPGLNTSSVREIRTGRSRRRSDSLSGTESLPCPPRPSVSPPPTPSPRASSASRLPTVVSGREGVFETHARAASAAVRGETPRAALRGDHSPDTGLFSSVAAALGMQSTPPTQGRGSAAEGASSPHEDKMELGEGGGESSMDSTLYKVSKSLVDTLSGAFTGVVDMLSPHPHEPQEQSRVAVANA